jgi:hypothetical protein
MPIKSFPSAELSRATSLLLIFCLSPLSAEIRTGRNLFINPYPSYEAFYTDSLKRTALESPLPSFKKILPIQKLIGRLWPSPRYEDLLHRQGFSKADSRWLYHYTTRFLKRHRGVITQDATSLLESLADANLLAMALSPAPRLANQSLEDWAANVLHEYSKVHLSFFNGLSAPFKNKLFANKVLQGHHEKRMRRFLADHDDFGGVTHEDLRAQGVSIQEVSDHSSGRGRQIGAPVYRITFRKAGHAATIFLKGFEQNSLAGDGKRQPYKYEEFFYRMAALLKLSTTQATHFTDTQDPAMVSYTLMDQIPGDPSSFLFEGKGLHKKIKTEYASHENTLIKAFARWNALNDCLTAGDRAVVGKRNEQYPTNYLIDLAALKRRDPTAVASIDHVHLFNTDDRFLLQSLRKEGAAELGVLLTFKESATLEGLHSLLKRYESYYQLEWKQIRRHQQLIEKALTDYFGEESEEKHIFKATMRKNSKDLFARQKDALLDFYQTRAPSLTTISSTEPSPKSISWRSTLGRWWGLLLIPVLFISSGLTPQRPSVDSSMKYYSQAS